MTRTYDIYTVIVRRHDSPKWNDYDGHGCFKEEACQQAAELKALGVIVAIRTDTYKRSKVAQPAIKTTFERI